MRKGIVLTYYVTVGIILLGTLEPTGSVFTDEIAQKTAQSVQDLLPAVNLYTPEEMRKSFHWQHITPFGDRKFYFEILVHNDWDSRPLSVTRQQLAEDDKALVPMAKLTPDGENENAVIEVYYMRVPPHATLERFVNAFAEQTGSTIVVQQRGEFNERQVEDALLHMEIKDFGSTLTRITASRRGEFIFAVACSAPEAEYSKYKRIFGVAVVNFDPSGR
jgi:hypothetical protein